MMTYPVDAEQADRTVRDCLQGIALRDITRKIEAADDAQLCHLLAEKKRLVRGEESAG
jgi:hypothetical protein